MNRFSFTARVPRPKETEPGSEYDSAIARLLVGTEWLWRGTRFTVEAAFGSEVRVSSGT
jgi:hypothetical protein